MLPTLSTARVATLLAVVVALFASGVAAGAAGAALIIGQSNGAGSTSTTLNSSSSGPTLRLNNNGTGRGLEVEADGVAPLRLIAPTGVAPLSVNSTKKVANLNADRLDGLDSSQFLTVSTLSTGHFTCPGAATVPETASAAANHGIYNFSRYVTSGLGGTYACTVTLPEGATITEFRVGIYDGSATEQIYWCRMFRVSLADGTTAVLAQTPDSGVEEQPGHTTLVDATVEQPVVSNAEFSYGAECTIAGTGSDLRLHGMQVTYEIEGLPVW